MEDLAKRVAQLETNLLIAEEALDASVADRKLIHKDLDTLATVLMRIVKQRQKEKDAPARQKRRRVKAAS